MGLIAMRAVTLTAIPTQIHARQHRAISRTRASPFAGTDLPGGGQELVEYASTGNLKKLTDLLDGPYTMTPTDASGKAVRVAQLRTAAQRAMTTGHVACLKALLAHGESHGLDYGFNAANGRLCAVEAAGAGRADVLRVLFETARLGTEVVNGYGRTALLEAALNGHEDCVLVCLEFGADVNFRTKNQGITAAHLAAQQGSIAVLNVLREAGANMDAERFGDFKTPLALHREHVQKQMKAFAR